MKRYLGIIFVLVLPLASFGAIDLRKELGEATFMESGLDKLSAKELAVLGGAVEKLLNTQEDVMRAENALPQGEDRFGLETVKERVQTLFQSEGPKRIESRILGEFTGWKGGTKFNLENGQVWQQTERGSFKVRKMKDPEVVIRRGMLGSYMLKVEGYGTNVKVERIK
jgi:hypothetical protein